MSDLWPDFNKFKIEIEDNHALEILREQAKLLSQKTNGKIKATFAKINYLGNSLKMLQSAMNYVEVNESETKGKKDVNDLYNFVNYKFEIYNSTYKFRVFILKYRPIYPIKIEVDEGIREEFSWFETTKDIINDNDLKETIATIFSSKKLQTIINRIMSSD